MGVRGGGGEVGVRLDGVRVERKRGREGMAAHQS